jgi:hypothetical protein
LSSSSRVLSCANCYLPLGQHPSFLRDPSAPTAATAFQYHSLLIAAAALHELRVPEARHRIIWATKYASWASEKHELALNLFYKTMKKQQMQQKHYSNRVASIRSLSLTCRDLHTIGQEALLTRPATNLYKIRRLVSQLFHNQHLIQKMTSLDGMTKKIEHRVGRFRHPQLSYDLQGHPRQG